MVCGARFSPSLKYDMSAADAEATKVAQRAGVEHAKA
jgi:hypothetical protein